MSFRLSVFAIASVLISATVVGAQQMPGENHSAAFAPALEAYEVDLAKECASFEGGTLETNQGGLQTVADFNGDGITDPILDTGIYTCSTMASFNSGTGGRLIVVFVSSEQAEHGYQRFEFLGEGNITTSLGDRSILLLAEHGASCERAGFEPCFGAYSWSQDHFASAGGQVRATE
ncbi:hypothetical protein MWU76_19085 [Gelidibacter sp. F2691]|nr:hypothetical protein [Gelidibacter sp. F2691]